MKVSRYTKEVKISDEMYMQYNIASRQYIVYPAEKKEQIADFLKHINKGVYTKEEIELARMCLDKRIILKDNVNELETLKYLENKACFQNRVFDIMIFVTNACNFRCSYCVQEHLEKRLDERVIVNILEFAKAVTKQVRVFRVTWFGGEPLLEYKKIKYVLEELEKICVDNHCRLASEIVTNGFLLDGEKIKELKKLYVENVQITLDGNQVLHDKRRPLANGSGTYKKVVENLIELLKEEIPVILRINVDSESMQMPFEVLEEIPEKYRQRVVVNICNIFQNKERVSTYRLYKDVIDMGYCYGQRFNSYAGCIASKSNSLILDVDGSILLCPNTSADEKTIGMLRGGAHLHYSDINQYYEMQNISITDNQECKECMELPYCIGACKYGRRKDNSKCIGKRSDGMTLDERARLDYYDDLRKQMKGNMEKNV